MNLSKFFVDRPIFAGVLSLLIFLGGLIALRSLPISEYPEVVPPTVIVRAQYPGANPKVLAETVIPGMRERGWGRIVNVASTSVLEPIPGLALSNSHRMATVGLFKTLADEVAGDGITVNTVATGLFATDRLGALHGSIEEAEKSAKANVPAGRLGLPEEFGDLVAFLSSDRAAYLTGAVIPVDGGFSIPRL